MFPTPYGIYYFQVSICCSHTKAKKTISLAGMLSTVQSVQFSYWATTIMLESSQAFDELLHSILINSTCNLDDYSFEKIPVNYKSFWDSWEYQKLVQKFGSLNLWFTEVKSRHSRERLNIQNDNFSYSLSIYHV